MEKEITTNELMEFLQENMATKADLKNMATKADIKNMATKDEIESLESKMDANFRMVMKDIDEVKEGLGRLEKMTSEDTSAMMKDIVELDNRLEIVEKKEKFKVR